MKVIDHIRSAQNTLISFEILPPLKGKTINSIYEHLDPLMEFRPSFINVTYHRSEFVFKKKADSSFEKVEVRKRPGTVGICAGIMNHYKIDAVPHLICGGFNKRETEDALIDLNFIGVDNVLVLRGDAAKNETLFEPEPGGNRYAIDLLKQTVDLNHGIYLEEDIRDGFRTNFCIGVAGYPEKHFEAPNLETDLTYLKEKVEAGAEYITTQMFFDNLAIPADANNVAEAHELINYLYRPDVAAKNSDFLSYANGNVASQKLINPKIFNDKTIYPDEATEKRLFIITARDLPTQRIINRLWTRVKTGR